MIDVNLKYITEAHFGKSERTNFDQLPADISSRLKLKSDAVAMVSKTGNQVMFVYKRDEAARTLMSVRVRLNGRGRWNPLMLSEYADRAGLNIAGLKRFEDYYRTLTSTGK